MTIEIPRGVIEDLIPVYLSGEATADTKALVEQYAASHPEIRKQLQMPALPELPARDDLGIQALSYTRKLLNRRTTLLAWAAASSYSVFSIYHNGKQIAFLLFRDAPAIAWTLLAVSSVLYAMFYWTCRRLVVTGLGAPHSLLVWGVAAAVASVPFTVVASSQTGWELVRFIAIPAVFAGIAMARSLNAQATHGVEPLMRYPGRL